MQLRPQVRLQEAIEYLKKQIQEVDTAFRNAHGHDPVGLYLVWINQASRELPDRFADRTLVEMLHTPHYWYIRNPNTERNKADLVAQELRIHKERFQETLDHLQLFEPMARHVQIPVVLDTNVLVNFDPLSDRISYERWLEITGQRWPAEFQVVIPVLVIDEIDGFAHTGDRKLNVKARKALSSLDRFVGALQHRGALPVRDDAGWMTVEVLPDAPGHLRQADADIELLDRAQFLHQITDLRVTLITADRGMRVRGMVRQILPAGSGVNVVAMPEELRVQDEPQPQPSKAGGTRGSTGSQPSAAASPSPDSPIRS
jgi:hypothetical protein